MDYIYEQFMEMGLGISPAMMSTLPTYTGGSSTLEFETFLPIQWIPITDNTGSIIGWDEGEERDNPESYIERADWMHHYLSRYAENVTLNTPQKLCVQDLGSQQEERIGLGFITYVESWNEPDRTWVSPEAEFTPQEYAAMASADFDGHGNSFMGDDGNGSEYPLGVRNLSPTLRFVMGAPFALEYRGDGNIYNSENPLDRINVWTKWIQPMIDWFDENRGEGFFPFDVVNIHHYTVSNPSDLTNGKWQSPEKNGVRNMIETEVVERMEALGWRNADNNYRELWISEFGYDTNQEDINCLLYTSPSPRD